MDKPMITEPNINIGQATIILTFDFIIMKLKAKTFNLCVAVFIAMSGAILSTACGGTTSVTDEEAINAGYTIGRIISGN